MTNGTDPAASGTDRGEEQAPPGIDVRTPSPARIYDVFLGGKDNYAADRAAAEIAMEAGPDIPRAARENRAFLGRAVRLAVESGIRQFLDLGTGLPTQGNVHEAAQSLAPDARVVYVDNDPIVLVHARALLPPSETTIVIQADFREPAAILEHPKTRSLIDFDEPVAVLMLAVLHFATDDEIRDAIKAFREVMAPGSLLIMSHSTTEGHPETGDKAVSAWKNATARLRSRTQKEVEALFDGFDLLEPGVVWVPQWRPDPGTGDGTRWMYAGVARKP
ncbi:SAM-dependent methyltransferase [Actinoallomurus purpureus]|uniref:SAM-dependent methyltransferase n=1 Tax=Actinoallomurus purpureus TaxID=478114 RepID=UPI002093CCF2|nr:SAM-dependent methyltransferase [Actinoallomurus purpureus]MCO6008739.1 SAM-dependent methyltransferase [Actinoallomurus purpureus]